LISASGAFPGTAAARLPGKAPEAEIKKRAARLRALDARLREAFYRRALGRERVVVPLNGGRQGLTEDFLTVPLPADPGRGLRKIMVH
jgi:tRNA A37 methylthiotransferase MiaB